MASTARNLRADVERIWRAGVAAVLPERLVPEHVQVDGDWLLVGDESIDLGTIERIAIVGAAKRLARWRSPLEKVLGRSYSPRRTSSVGSTCRPIVLFPPRRIHLHAARPAGVNEPRPEGVEGTRRILEIVSYTWPARLVLLLADRRRLGLAARAGSRDLARRKDSLDATCSVPQAPTSNNSTSCAAKSAHVKGGGLARACRAGRLISLLISDVLGDRLDIIASGPTVESNATPHDALAILKDLRLSADPINRRCRELPATKRGEFNRVPGVEASERPGRTATHIILGNNATAVDAAGMEAERLGYSHAMIAATQPEKARRKRSAATWPKWRYECATNPAPIA